MRVICLVTCLVVLVTCQAINASEPTVKTETATNLTLPHCEVPCGIYADQRRFEEMLEDTATIAKAIASVNEMVKGTAEGPPTATSVNQFVRWVNTKESHATNIQHIVSQYFLTQRIKPDHKDYVAQLKASHAVMVAAMKCKQDSNPATAETLKNAIYDLYRAYEGKEPQLHEKKE